MEKVISGVKLACDLIAFNFACKSDFDFENFAYESRLWIK